MPDLDLTMNMTTKDETPMAITDDLTPENSRRAALRSLGKVGLGLAFASAPAILATSGKAYASGVAKSGGRSVEDVLRFALTLEYLERDFYIAALDTENLIPADARPLFETIRDHEAAHVTFLETQIFGEDTPDPAPTFDFTAGGTLDPFGNYNTFLLLSQAFEDTGVRAYKGQVTFLAANDADVVLTAALGIHSVESRHASKVRRVRGLQGWIPFDNSDGAPAAIYAGMNQTVKYNVDVPAVSGVSAESVTEAWDEPLTTEEVLAIVAPFIEA